MSLDHTKISACEEGSLCVILAGAQEPDSSSN